MLGTANSRPEIQLFAAGSPDTFNRTIDVASLSSWLAVRAIDRETRRLDAIERGEPPPAEPAVPPSTAALPSVTPQPSTSQPIATQQAAPLPPPIEVRPAPGAIAPKPKPRPPRVLTPPLANP